MGIYMYMCDCYALGYNALNMNDEELRENFLQVVSKHDEVL